MRRATLTCFLLALAAASPSSAQTEQPDHPFRNLVHARSMAMGGAFRAFGLGLETVTGNPAAMSLYQHYNLEASGAWDITQRAAWASAGVMDSTNKIAGGVAYHLVSWGEFADRTLAHLNTLALSAPLVENTVYIGASVHYLFSTGALRANAVTGDAGLIVRLFEAFTIGLSANNVVDTRHSDLSTYFTAAAAFSNGTLSVVADARGEYQEGAAPKLGFNVGGELVFAEGIPLRAGWALDESGHTFLSGGAGWMFQGGSIDGAYRHETNGIGRAIAVTVKISN
jgi:hypothetical protein